MRGLDHGPQRPAFVQGDRERHRRRRIHRVEVRTRDLHGVLVKRNVADEMLGQRGMLSSGADAYRDVEPFTALDGVRRDDLRRVLCIVARMDTLKFRRELLRLLTGGVDPRNTRAEKKEKHRESDASLNSNGVTISAPPIRGSGLR